MLVIDLLSSVIDNNDVATLFQVKDEFLLPKERQYLVFVKEFYQKHAKLPDIDTVQNKFNILLPENQEPAAYWKDEIVQKFQESVIERGITEAAKNKGKAIEIFQQSILEYNVDLDTKVVAQNDGQRKKDRYSLVKQNKGIAHISTGSPELDAFSLGYNRADLWTLGGAEGSGKSLPLSEPVLTPHGWKTMGDITMGSLVVGQDGKPTKVIGVYPQGIRDIYKVTFADGTFVYCDLDHLWASENCQDRRKKRGFKVRTLREIKEHLERTPKAYYRIPVTKPVQFIPTAKLPLDPYTLGVILGDGNITRGEVVVTTADPDIIRRIESCNPYEVKSRSSNSSGKATSYGISGGIVPVVRKLGLIGTNSHTKFIPECYLYTTTSNRIDLLRGLMDTDGCISSRANGAEFNSRSAKLADGVIELVRSLGGIAMLYTKEVEGEPFYTVSVSFYSDNFINPFWLSRKADKMNPKSKWSNYGKIIRSIEFSHKEEAKCIAVDNSDKLYLTRGYNVTHNTWKLCRMANDLDYHLLANNIDRNILFVSGEMDADEIEGRNDCIRCGLPYGAFSKGQLSGLQERRYNTYADTDNSNIKIIDSFDGLKDVEYFIMVLNPIAVFLDGSHLLASSYDWTDIAKVTSTMKKITRNKKVPFINTTHLKADKGKSGKGGTIDDFAYTKGYTRDSDIAGVLFKDEMMELENKYGIDWVKVRRGNRTRMIWEQNYDNASEKLVESLAGQMLAAAKVNNMGSVGLPPADDGKGGSLY